MGFPRSATVLFLLAGLAVSLSAPGVALAGSDYSDKSFGLRLPPAFVRFRDVSTSGGQTVANRYSSAINPAATDWTEVPSKFGVVLAPYFSAAMFRAGTQLYLTGEAVNWDTRTCGTVQPTLAQINSNQVANRQGIEFEYDVDIFQLQWGKRWGDWAFGMNFNYADAMVTQHAGGMLLSRGRGDSWRFRFGGLWEPIERWLFGAAFEYGFAPSESTVWMPTEFGIVQVKDTGTHHQYILRQGVSYEYGDMSSVYLDYQFAVYADGGDRLESHRWNLGAEHRLLQWLFLRGDVAMDSRGNPGLSAGVGMHLGECCTIDVGYHYDIYPELNREFGRSNTLQFTFSFRF